MQVREAQAWDARTGAGVLFVGDMESWRGTFMGMSWSGFTHVPALFQRMFGPFNSTILAIAGEPSSDVCACSCTWLSVGPDNRSQGPWA